MEGSKSDPVEERRQRLRASPDLAEMLRDVDFPPVKWGMLLLGMADVRTLKLLEALEGVPQCQGYYFSELRGGWNREAHNLAQELKTWEQMARKGGNILPPPSASTAAKPSLKRPISNGTAMAGLCSSFSTNSPFLIPLTCS